VNTTWTCPTCSSRKLAPRRARRNDVRTYCLACSEKTGRLVRRAPLALVAARSAREAAGPRCSASTAVDGGTPPTATACPLGRIASETPELFGEEGNP
jgi:hypothetical protein